MISETTGIHYRDGIPNGSPCVVLLHGLGATGDCWGYQVPALAGAGYRVIVPDLPGFGRSPWNGTCEVADMARSVAGHLEHLGVSRANVAGISMGGTVALQLALDRPDLVERLVLVSTFARLQPTKPSGWLVFGFRLFLVRFVGMDSQARAVAARLFPGEEQEELRRSFVEQFMQADPRAYRAAILALGRFDQSRRLGEIKAPTLVVTGTEDRTIDPGNQEKLLAIPGSRHLVIAGAGHGLIADHPDEFNRALLGFLVSPDLLALRSA